MFKEREREKNFPFMYFHVRKNRSIVILKLAAVVG